VSGSGTGSARPGSRLLAITVVVGLGLGTSAHADEPGMDGAVSEEPGLSPRLLRSPPAPRGLFAPRSRGPSMELSYRSFSIADQGGRDQRFHVFAIERIFVSRILRLGGGFEGAFDSTPRDDFLLTTAVRVGIQHPSRLNPFLDAVFSFGVLRRDLLEQDLFSFTWHAGIEGGACFFLHPRFFLSFALGWRRVVVRHGGNEDVETAYFYYDSLAIRAGLGF
jgi:hypothetical protein